MEIELESKLIKGKPGVEILLVKGVDPDMNMNFTINDGKLSFIINGRIHEVITTNKDWIFLGSIINISEEQCKLLVEDSGGDIYHKSVPKHYRNYLGSHSPFTTEEYIEVFRLTSAKKSFDTLLKYNSISTAFHTLVFFFSLLEEETPTKEVESKIELCDNVKVLHSKSKSSWNIVSNKLNTKFKIAQIPYVTDDRFKEVSEKNRLEAFEYANFISKALNNMKEVKRLF